MNRELLKEKIKDRVEYDLRCMKCSDSIEDNCGDDPEAPAWIRAELRKGNTWAWCDVTVTASITAKGNNFWQGRADIHCSSYESEDGFKGGDYYEVMNDEALDDLANAMMRTIDNLVVLGFQVSL